VALNKYGLNYDSHIYCFPLSIVLFRDPNEKPNGVGVFLPSPEDGSDPNPETLCFLVFTIPDDEQSPEAQ
jgi:hypothetical protein